MTPRIARFVLIVAAAGIPASAMGMASAELYRTQAQTYGRFEARIQFAPGDGVVSSFFLWKEGSDAANAYWNELDYEKVGADCHMQINNIYGNPETQHQQTPSLSGICTGYHDYRFEWTPTYIAWVVDGKEIRRDTGDAATAYAQNATAGMTIHFNIWPGNSTFGGNINNTTLPVHQYISWVQYSSYDNGNFTVQWREDFQNSGVPSGWAVGNWSSPYNLSTHNPQNVAFVNGISVLSLTADNATGSPGTPPVDTSVGGASGSGGSGGSGGLSGPGGSTGTGGATSTGGTTGTGGTTKTGGTTGTGGSTGAGGSTGVGGTVSSGGVTRAGGTITSGGAAGAGGTTSASGTPGLGGRTTSGGDVGSGGTSSPGGTSAGDATGSGGAPSGGTTGMSGTSTTGGATNGSSSTTATRVQGGCSCSSTHTANPFHPTLVAIVLFLIVLRQRRKEI